MGDVTRSRVAMQSWENFPFYLSAGIWERFADNNFSSSSALAALMSHLHALGLRAPNESTQGMVTAMLVMKESEERQRNLRGNPGNLRTMYLNVKGQMQVALQQRKTLGTALPDNMFLQVLPADPRDASQSIRSIAYHPDDFIVPPRCSVQELRELSASIPYRSTNRSAQAMCPALPPQQLLMAAGQAMMVGLSMSAGMLGSNLGNAGSGVVTMVPPKAQPLHRLLGQAVGAAQASPAPLALEDMPRAATAAVPPVPVKAPPPDAPASASLTLTNGSAEHVHVDGAEHVANPGQAETGAQPLPVDAEQSHENVDPPASLDTGNAVKTHGKKTGLAESLDRISKARGTGNQHPLKRPAAAGQPSSSTSKPSSSTSSSCMKRPGGKVSNTKVKGNSTVMKRPGSNKKGMSQDRIKKAEMKAKILAKISPSLKKKYKQGCSTCRYVANCTLSCWLKRGWTA